MQLAKFFLWWKAYSLLFSALVDVIILNMIFLIIYDFTLLSLFSFVSWQWGKFIYSLTTTSLSFFLSFLVYLSFECCLITQTLLLGNEVLSQWKTFFPLSRLRLIIFSYKIWWKVLFQRNFLKKARRTMLIERTTRRMADARFPCFKEFCSVA